MKEKSRFLQFLTQTVTTENSSYWLIYAQTATFRFPCFAYGKIVKCNIAIHATIPTFNIQYTIIYVKPSARLFIYACLYDVLSWYEFIIFLLTPSSFSTCLSLTNRINWRLYVFYSFYGRVFPGGKFPQRKFPAVNW